MIADTAELGVVRELLATPLKVVDITDGLVFAPGAQGVGAMSIRSASAEREKRNAVTR